MAKKHTKDGRRIYLEMKDADHRKIILSTNLFNKHQVRIVSGMAWPCFTPSQARRLAKALNRFADECEGKEQG